MDRRAEPDCLKERGGSPGGAGISAPTQVRRRPAPTKRRWRSSSVPLGDLQRRCSDRGFTILSFAFIRVRLITQITIDVGAGGRLTRIRRTFVNLIRKEVPPPCRRLAIQRTPDGDARFIKHVRVDHRGRHIFVTEQFLHSANIIPVFQQVSSKTVAPRKSYAHAVGMIGFLLR
jgi:hypothetical protein